MKKVRYAVRLVFYNWKPLAGFEILYKLAAVVFFVPLLYGTFNLTMGITGYSYLTLENVIPFILKPATLFMLAIILILAAIYAMIDISATVFVLDQSVKGNRVTFGQVVHFAVRNSIRVWKPQNVALVPVVLLLLPFVHIGLASGFLTTVSIPEFILDTIKANAVLSWMFGVAAVLLTVVAVRWLYAFFYFTLEGCSFREARRKSAALGKGKRTRDFAELLGMQFAAAIVYLVLLVILVAAASFVGKLFSGVFLLKWLGSTIVWMMVVFVLAVIAALAIPLGYGCVGILYYRRKNEIGETIIHASAPEIREHPRFDPVFKAAKAVFATIVAAVSLVLGFLLSSGRINPNIEYLRTMEITAHRGASAFYPENTMAAFVGAKDMGADWIELDVQQSRDGQIFVAHDTNFERTTGVDADTWELTYDEIAELDAGSFFSEAYAGEKIPLLSTVIEFAKENGMRLNIELKPTGHEADFEKCVVDVIRSAGFEDNCVITSQVYEVLENVKAYSEEITTVYVMSIAYGDINQLTAADHFSVEAMNVTRSMISRVHNAGKQLYAWTVNTKESITKMIEMNVDNIITDDIELARECIYESRYSSLLRELLKALE